MLRQRARDQISFVNVRVEWTGGADEDNGAYGIYPVESDGVLIDGVKVSGASDAGIYVGQSKRITVRNSIAEANVAGIEIENSYNADVHGNVATRNTGGILVFDLPNLPQMGGHSTRLFRNKVVNNDTPNFAPKGNIVANVPVGTGVMIMANRNVHVFENDTGPDGANHDKTAVFSMMGTSSMSNTPAPWMPFCISIPVMRKVEPWPSLDSISRSFSIKGRSWYCPTARTRQAGSPQRYAS